MAGSEQVELPRSSSGVRPAVPEVISPGPARILRSGLWLVGYWTFTSLKRRTFGAVLWLPLPQSPLPQSPHSLPNYRQRSTMPPMVIPALYTSSESSSAANAWVLIPLGVVTFMLTVFVAFRSPATSFLHMLAGMFLLSFVNFYVIPAFRTREKQRHKDGTPLADQITDTMCE